MRIKCTAPLLAATLALSACGSTPAQQDQLKATGLTLAAIAAQNNTTVARIVARGGLFCLQGGGDGVIAVINAAGVSASVVGQSADVVAQTCAALQAVPVPPPLNPGAVPVQAVKTALPPVAP